MTTQLHTTDAASITYDLKRAWHQMTTLAQRASSEAARASDGEASQETKNALAQVNDLITMLEQRLTQAPAPLDLKWQAAVRA